MAALSKPASKPNRPDIRLQKTRAALYAALLALLEEKGVDQITIREIAARAAVGHATFYRHYDTKEELLKDLAADQIAELMKLAFPAFQATDSLAASKALCTFVDRHRKLWTVLLTGGARGIVREEFLRQAGAVKESRRPSSSWLPSDIAAIYGVSSTVEILAWWLQKGDAVSAEQAARILNHLVVAPFVPIVADTAAKKPRAKSR